MDNFTSLSTNFGKKILPKVMASLCVYSKPLILHYDHDQDIL